MVKYDPAIIRTFAERLYQQALGVVIQWTIIGAIMGAAVLVGFMVLTNPRSTIGPAELGIGAVLGGILGYFAGQSRAFALRLQAQTALCQVEIEENTRPAAAGSRAA